MKTAPSDEKITQLIRQLGSKDGNVRERARTMLVAIGKPAVPKLMEILAHPKTIMRWEACKALGSIKNPASAPSLVSALDDENVDVQWVAAEALVALKAKALAPLLSALTVHFDSLSLKQGARHILRALQKEHLLNQRTLQVLDTLRVFGPRVAIPIAAQKALNSLQRSD